MKGSVKGYIGSFLFALNVFVLFLLLFEDALIVPLWLQPVGRMHPLILHFPIVLVLLGMAMEFFRHNKHYSGQDLYKKFTEGVLLTGVITAGIAVIMGLFLSKEEGYSSTVLAWHKWTGAVLFFITSFIYSYRNSSWYNPTVAKAGAIVTTLCLLSTGHFGSVLTHGDNFIWQPLMVHSNTMVKFEDALVFDHVVKPIFEAKCIGCHNPDKLKGRLVLLDSTSISKGGKTGKLFVAGKPDSSLLLDRLHLPHDNKNHMPPSGKTQLTSQELGLLELWIHADARFNQKVSALPDEDSFKILATAFLKPKELKEEIFHFAAADEETVKNLNTFYRVVSPLSNKSPALTVNIYNREAFTPTTLAELKEVRRQIISLNLNKMPIQDQDLKVIAGFENLQSLNLNFTDITGQGLATLAVLKHLESLSLSGTKIPYTDLKRQLPSFKSLRKLAIWDTPLSISEVNELRAANPQVQLLTGFQDDGSHPIKLNLPRLKDKPVVFTDSLPLQLFHPVKGVEIRFTTDGTDPDSITAAVFTGETVLKESTMIKARAYKTGWLSSDVASLYVYRCAHKPDSTILLTRLNRVHPANGALTFFDQHFGSFNANSPAWANNWAGFIRNDMELLLEFKTPGEVTSVALNTLIETETSIFPPASIEIWGGPTADKLELISRIKPELPKTYFKPYIKLIECEFKPRKVSILKIIARPVMKLPEWHKNKDKPALLLIDELFIN